MPRAVPFSRPLVWSKGKGLGAAHAGARQSLQEVPLPPGGGGEWARGCVCVCVYLDLRTCVFRTPLLSALLPSALLGPKPTFSIFKRAPWQPELISYSRLAAAFP
jgi:hypothetical protein